MDHGNQRLEGLDSLWSPCWMKKWLDFVFVLLCDLLGLQEHHFYLLLLAFLSTHPAVTNGGGLKANGEPQISSSDPWRENKWLLL